MLSTVPDVIFKTRVRDENIGGDNPFRWQDVSTDDIFKGKKIVVLALPGAFTPTCSSKHLPGYEDKYQELIIPTAVFSQLNIGTAGLTEVQAREKHLDINIYKTSFNLMWSDFALPAMASGFRKKGVWNKFAVNRRSIA